MNKIVAITMIKNECDIIESFVRHHLNIVDEMIIVDHNSCDSTPEILKNLKEEGLPIHISTDFRVEQAQAEIMTNLMYKAIEELNADIILPLDADEFIVNIATKENCRDILTNADINSIYDIKSIIFFPADETNNEQFLLWKNNYKMSSVQDYVKIIVGRNSIESAYGSCLCQGNHDIIFSKRKRGNISRNMFNNLVIAHFPVRSDIQFISKISVGWINNLARYNKNIGDAGQWHNAFEKIKQNIEIDLREKINIIAQQKSTDAEIFRLKKFCKNVDIKYFDKISINPLTNILVSSELLAVEYSQIVKNEKSITYLIKTIIRTLKNNIRYFYNRKIKGIVIHI